MSGVSTTGHEWDGIKELNNPLPRWWVWTFYATIVWALAYTIAYPAWPMLKSATHGVLGYSSRDAVKQELATAEAAKGQYVEAIKSKDVKLSSPTTSFASSPLLPGPPASRSIACSVTVQGPKVPPGFPNLNDDDWLWGGEPTRSTRPFPTASGSTPTAIPGPRKCRPLAKFWSPNRFLKSSAYVASLTEPVANASLIESGATVFAENCAACHGENAKGNREFGAPDLTDAIWLKGSGEAAIAAQVRAPKHGVMPAWAARLGDTKVKELSVYVHSLGGGQ